MIKKTVGYFAARFKESYRFVLATGFFLVLYGFLGVHLYGLQIEHGVASNANASTGDITKDLVRGVINFTDKNNALIPAASNKEYPNLAANPEALAREGRDLKELSSNIALVLGTDNADEIYAKISDPKRQYEELAKNVPESVVTEINSWNMKGIYISNDKKRFYPFGTLASQVIGFVSKEGEGKYGLEAYYDDELSGKNDITGIGEDISLTIDPTVQTQSEKILADLVSKFKAKQGQVIVMEPKTGKILAMASTPTYDPNDYGKANNMADYLNRTVQTTYEPGSVFKIVTVSAGIDSHSFTPETTYYDSGTAVINGRTIKNWDNKSHGTLTMAQVIEQSINTGTIFMEQRMGEQTFLSYIKKFGIDKKLDIAGLPGEVSGNISSLEKNTAPVNFATASYGHGVSVTPLRMLTAVNAVANDGVMMKPFIIAGTKEESLGQPITKETAETVKKIMISAVDKAVVAHIKNYSVAGKTGTALVPKNGRYTEDVINTYIGFAPASDPRFSILLRMDEPEGAPLAGQTIVPAFRNLAEFLLVYYNVVPDRIENEKNAN